MYSGLRFREGIYTLVFTVQSNFFDSDEIIDRILKFISRAEEDIDNISEGVFDSFKEGIISRKLEPDQRLTGQAGRFWSEIILSDSSQGPPNFYRPQQEAKLIEDMTLGDFKGFAFEVLNSRGTKHHLLVSAVQSQRIKRGGDGKKTHTVLFREIDDPLKFMQSRPPV